MKSFTQWADETFGSRFCDEDTLTYFRMNAAWAAALEEAAKVCEPVEGSAYAMDVYKAMQSLAAAIRGLK